MTRFFSFLWLIGAVLLAACQPIIPAQVPEQLALTPGYMTHIDDRYYETASFRVRYPPGWQIIKSNIHVGAAEVYFVSLDETMEIFVFITPLPEPEISDGVFFVEEQVMFSDDSGVFIRGTAPTAQQADFGTIFTALVNSIEQPDAE